MSLSDTNPDVLLLLMSDFVTKAMFHFAGDFVKKDEIPTFDGGLPMDTVKDSSQLLDLIGGIGWTLQCKKSLLNDNFFWLDLISSLSICHLVVSGKTLDIPILGATLTIASSAVRIRDRPKISSNHHVTS